MIWYLKFYPYHRLLVPEDKEQYAYRLASEAFWDAENHPDHAFIVTAGHMRVLRPQPNGCTVTVEVLNAGEVVGTFSVKKDETAKTELVMAMADGCEGVLLDKKTLLRRAATWELPPIAVRCASGLWYGTVKTHPLHLLFRTLEARLASALLLVAQQIPRREEGERFLIIPPPPPPLLALSDLAGSNHELARQVLAQWEAKGIIQHPYKWFTLLDKEALWAIANPKDEEGHAPHSAK